jgi:TatD DNase family protein
LDFSPAPPTEKDRRKKEQIFLFKKQIEIACQLNLPLIIHSRQARQEVVEMLVYDTRVLNSPLRGVFHCYSGGKNDIKKVEEIGFYFGVDGNLTYDLGLQNVGKLIPLEKILLETDCPFLSPQPYRGLRNEPKNVKLIAEFLAKLKEVSFEKIAQITTQNTKVLFKI